MQRLHFLHHINNKPDINHKKSPSVQEGDFLYNKFMLVSVVVTSYNYQKYIKDTIISVLNQTFKDWEMIVIDDASTDASVKIIQELTKNDSRVKLIQNSENIGLKNSIKKALKEASGEWIAFLESDDLWREDYLEKKLH